MSFFASLWMTNYYCLNEIFQYVPYRKDVTHRTTQYEEVEDGMHIGAFVQWIEQRSCDVASSLTDNPTYSTRTYGIHQWLEGNEYYQSHQYITDGFQIAMLLQLAETHDGSHNRT